MKLREYQQECVDVVNQIGSGNFLICMATGLGKTVTFANFKRQGKTLLLAHREELINQPKKYFNCSVGVEMAKETSNGEDVIIASVQSLIRRLEKFDKNHFDRIITDEAHHATSPSYMKIYDYFNYRQHIGVTATPNRHDKTGLEKVFEKIIYEKDIKFGIKNNYLSNIDCLRVDIGYDLRGVKKKLGDFAQDELAKRMEVTAGAVAEAYKQTAKGQTLIFATSVQHAHDVASKIKGAVAVDANTQNRSDIIKQFTERKIPCLTNCMVFTEGTDIPLIETIIIARPTQNLSLYAQMVGRGLRLYEGKEKLLLVDCVGASENEICTAPSLLGLCMDTVPSEKREKIQGDLFDLGDLIIGESDIVENWITNIKRVDIWAKEQNYKTYDMNIFKMPNGDFVCQLPNKTKFTIPAQDDLGYTNLFGEKIKMQEAFDRLFLKLRSEYQDSRAIWDLSLAKRWGSAPASDAQMNLIRKILKNKNIKEMSKLEASQVLNRVMNK